jgi:hypothetical protein
MSTHSVKALIVFPGGMKFPLMRVFLSHYACPAKTKPPFARSKLSLVLRTTTSPASMNLRISFSLASLRIA